MRILVDCGLYQERKLRGRNWDGFPIPPRTIDAVLLTHAHLDHCGLMPKLVREGFDGKIYCTEATAEIARIILLDSAHIQEEDAEFKRRRHEREGRKGPHADVPLYTTADAEKCLPHFSPIEYEQTVQVADGAEAVFRDAGHIFGSSIIRLKISKNGEARTILFSGDLGRRNMPIIDDPSEFSHADYVLIESTYGDRIHGKAEDVENRLAEIINATKQTGGNIIIPSFALERSQDLMYYLNELFLSNRIPQIPVYLDSPMAIRVTEVFKEHPELFDDAMSKRVNGRASPFAFKGLKMTRTTNESKAIRNASGTSIIIAGSGMCTGGRVKHHLVNNITGPENTILFVGYQAVGTLGRRITEGAEEVRILGRDHPVKAKIVTIDGFSAHADKNELFRWLSGLQKPPKHVFVVHGEAESAKYFGNYINEKTGWDVSVPEYKEEAVLD